LAEHSDTGEDVSVLEESAKTNCKQCYKEKFTDLMTQCSECNRLHCTECLNKIKENRARTWWWMGGFSMYFLSKGSDFKCRRCLKNSDNKGNIIVLALGTVIIVGTIVAAEMNGINIF